MASPGLVHELLRHPAAAGHATIALIGDRHRQVAPFHPIAAWIRARHDIRDTDDPATARARLAAAPPGADRALLERLLGIAAAAEPRARIDYSATVAALLAAAGPRLILHCEDLDCFDEASLDLLAGVLPRLADRQVLLLGTGRGRVRLPGTRLATIALAPLGDDEAARLLGGIDAGRAADPALAAEILRKAGGNPLFLEEVGPLAVRPAAGFDESSRPAIPDRVEELIADRLGRLEPEDRRLIQLGAVIGLDVPPACSPPSPASNPSAWRPPSPASPTASCSTKAAASPTPAGASSTPSPATSPTRRCSPPAAARSTATSSTCWRPKAPPPAATTSTISATTRSAPTLAPGRRLPPRRRRRRHGPHRLPRRPRRAAPRPHRRR